MIKEKTITYLNNKVFSGCGLATMYLDKDSLVRKKIYLGNTGKDEDSEVVTKYSLFDVASLTKPLVTFLSLLALIKDGKTRLSDNLGNLLPLDMPVEKKKITLHQLLSHRSGFPPHRHFYKNLLKIEVNRRKKEIVRLILDEKLEFVPGEYYLYSDLDYILLGIIIEERSGDSLQNYWQKKIIKPLGLTDHFSFPQKKVVNSSLFVETGECTWSHKKLSGLVHDDNCRALHCLSGHAGLFATLEGISALTETLLLLCNRQKKHPSIHSKDLFYLLDRKKNIRPAGFDIPSGDSPASGQYFSENTIGHLGFTGTSFWIDLKKEIIIVLLTNRVIYGNNNWKIKKMRSEIHDFILKDHINGMEKR